MNFGTVFLFQFVLLSVCHVQSLNQNKFNEVNQTTSFQQSDVTQENLRMIRDHLRKVNKPGRKTIIQDLPKRPNGYNLDGTIPFKRLNNEDILRSNNVSTFRRKTIIERSITSFPSINGHEYAIGYVDDNKFYGAKAIMNIWAPSVESESEFSLAQIWVLAGTFGVDLNSIEVGWQVSPKLYGDARPRLFGFWTRDSYQKTGCYNFKCSGFSQRSKKIDFGSVITPTSSYGGTQYEITLLVWKDAKSGNWWLQYESELVSYWSSSLFTHLKDHATIVQFGGEIVNSGGLDGSHTSTQMGSGHFSAEGWEKASYFKNLQVIDVNNNLIPTTNLQLYAERPNCYDIQKGVNDNWGNYFYYGGPGKNPKCT